MIASIDLLPPFGTRSAWRLTAAQSPPIPDPFGSPGDELPGAITLCLSRGGADPCDPQLQDRLFDTSDNGLFSERHYLRRAEIVHPRGSSGPALLLLAVASLHSGDGDQTVLTQLLAYHAASDRFRTVFQRSVGRNNNQEVRYIADGPLAGDVIVVEPTGAAPFGYWVTVHAFAGERGYRPVLRYRSATTYGDGNTLPVIDSEMPAIQRRLRVWRPGSPMPLPAAGCPTPHLLRMELWCG